MASEYEMSVTHHEGGGHPIRETVVHPTNSFVSFEKRDIEQSIPDRFEQQVSAYPGKIAVKTAKESLTYTQLNGLANQICRAILAKRTTRNEPVGLLFDQGVLLIAAILGTLKAGKIYLPLDPLGTGSVNTEVLMDSTARLLLTDTLHFAQAYELATKDISVIDVNEIDGSMSPENIGLPIPADRLAYIFYTSGSTGRPKGVADSHRNVIHNIMRYTNSLHISASDRLTLLQPGNFSGSVSSLFCALLNGATSLPYSIQQEGSGRLASWLHRECITIWHSVPSIYRLIATGTCKYPSLRIIRLEGDQVNLEDIRLYRKFFPDTCVMVNGLGSTECGIVRQYFIDKKTPLPESVVPIGYSVEDMEVLILDENKKEMEEGRVGEICVRSRYVAPGYWRNPELTEAVFWNDSEDGEKRIFRTGDLGRMRDDGCLDYLGRKDFQKKLRGRWVDIPAIEKALHEMSAFRDILVITREDPDCDVRLVAYLTAGKKPAPSVDRIRKYLSQSLPEHMIPSIFVMMKHIPLDPFGKVDRSALPAPGGKRPEMSEPYVPPRTPLQRQLKRIWEEVLNVRPVGIRDNFFDLGGDSLSAECLFALIEKKIVGQYLPTAAILQAPTVEQLTEMVRKKSWSTSSRPLVPIHPAGFGPPFFCVHGHDGNVLCYRDLAYNLGPDQPVYGIQAQGLSDATVKALSFEEMASYYINEIRTVQPRGPYYLGGSCMGGALSMEIAQQLRSQGDEVALLVMIEAPHPRYPKYLHNSTPFFRLTCQAIDGIYYRANRFLKANRKTRLTMMGNKTKRVMASMHINAEQICIPIMTKLGMPTDPSPGYKLKALGEAHREAYMNYRPKSYTGSVLLFVGKRQPLGTYPDSSLGWSKVIAERLEIIEVPGGPRSLIVEPWVLIVAEHIKNYVEGNRNRLREAT